MNVDGVTTGIVLDHIQAEKSMEIYRLLELDQLECSVAIIQNAVSTKYGKKDIININVSPFKKALCTFASSFFFLSSTLISIPFDWNSFCRAGQ
jgi:aspartate carbamoyltransferase regulatory subunit